MPTTSPPPPPPPSDSSSSPSSSPSPSAPSQVSSAPPLPGYAAYRYFYVTQPAEGVAHVEINRPQKLNSFARPVWMELGAVFRQLGLDGAVRAVVLSGAGERAFTAGLDVREAGADLQSDVSGPKDGARKAKALRGRMYEFQGMVSTIEECDKPVICVLHGIAIGLAIDLACCADVRICSSDVRLAVKEVDIGMAADIGTLSRLPKIVGSTSWVKDVCLTARDFSAEEARAVGFVSRVVPGKGKGAAVAAGIDMAATIASKSPVATSGTKELLNHARDHTTIESLRYTAAWNAANLQTNDFIEGMASGLNRTKPRFEKL